MTYGEACMARTAIGSGLIYHGVTKVSCPNFKLSLNIVMLS